MKETGINKIRILKIWEILSKETDEDNRITTTEIIERLKKFGLECDRKTVYNDIKLLNDNGYEIMCTRTYANEYYVIDRDFDMPEIQIMIDAVQASSFITEQKSKVLIDKLSKLAGTSKASVLKKNIVEFSTVKSKNETVYYSVNEITNAILKKKQITFNYFDIEIGNKKEYRKSHEDENLKKVYCVTPIKTVFYDDRYYLIAYSDKHKTATQYRIDRMENVNVSKEKGNSEAYKIDISEYQKTLFGMYGGKKVSLIMEADKSIVGGLYDRFGDNVKIVEIENNKCQASVKIKVGPPLISWLIGFGDKLKVISPTEVVEEIKKIIEKLSRIYFDCND